MDESSVGSFELCHSDAGIPWRPGIASFEKSFSYILGLLFIYMKKKLIMDIF
jgi:hypothetical protein